jgi:hypothetical protein
MGLVISKGLTLRKGFQPESYMYEFPNQYPVWSPAEITTALWLDAADSNTVEQSGGVVSEWRDKSGNSRHASQAASGSRPIVATASQNSLNGISFDGINDYLGFSSALLGATHSLFILFKPTIEPAVGTVFGQWQGGQTGRYLWATNQDAAGAVAAGALNVFNSTATEGGVASGPNSGFAIEVSITNTATLISSISTTGSEPTSGA